MATKSSSAKSYSSPVRPVEVEISPPLENCSNQDFSPHQKHILPHVHDTVSDHIAYGGGGKHSLSGVGFLCSDVIAMEKKYGRHVESCPHVGYIASTICCKGK